MFLYRAVLHLSLGDLGEIERVQRRPKVPVVLSKSEVQRVRAAVAPEYQLPLRLLYGTGLRLMELLRLRVHPVRSERWVVTGARVYGGESVAAGCMKAYLTG